MSSVWAGVSKLIDAAPDFVSVTYGAAGANRDTRDRSIEVLLKVLDQHPGLPAIAHLTCVGSQIADLRTIIRLLLRVGIRDFLALRGDYPEGDTSYVPQPGELTRSVELIDLIHEIARHQLGPDSEDIHSPNYVTVAVAGYPASTGLARANELDALMEKQSYGADLVITQVFYEESAYSSLLNEFRLTGGHIPIVPGILPFTDLRRLQALERISHVTIPQRILDIHTIGDARQRSAEALSATITLIDGVLKAGAPGVHVYSFNRTRPTLDIVEYLTACGFTRKSALSQSQGPPDVSAETLQLLTWALQRIPPNSSQ